MILMLPSPRRISTAISQLQSGKVPGLDGISLEMLRLGEEVTVGWLKSISPFEHTWQGVR